MIFTNHNKEVSHYIAERHNDVFSDTYSFYNMMRTENAYTNLIRLHTDLLGSNETDYNESTRFSLRLDLLGNLGNHFIQHKVNLLIHSIMQLGYKFSNGNAQENFEILNLSLADLSRIINDPTFQSANVIDTYSTWRVTIMS